MKNIDLEDFYSTIPKIKYSTAKKSIKISEDRPVNLYSDLDFFVKLLDNNNKIIKWTAIRVIGNLSLVDKRKKIDRLIPKLISFLSDRSMITAANTIESLTVIAINKPCFKDKIIKSLLKVEKTKYYSKGKVSPECTNVAIGHVIQSLDRLGREILKRIDVQKFLKRQTKCKRSKVKEMAEKILSNIDKENSTPGIKEILRHIGSKAKFWLDLEKFIKKNYKIKGEFKLMGKSWAYWFRKGGRTLVTFYPEHNNFIVQVVLGKKEVEKTNSMRFNRNINNIYKKAKQYHDGKWLFLPINNQSDIDNIKELILIKRKPSKK